MVQLETTNLEIVITTCWNNSFYITISIHSYHLVKTSKLLYKKSRYLSGRYLIRVFAKYSVSIVEQIDFIHTW